MVNSQWSWVALERGEDGGDDFARMRRWDTWMQAMKGDGRACANGLGAFFRAVHR
jgi:hypothetical protein